MRKSQAEILTELRLRLGHNENTEHIIDWVNDLWYTRDFLVRQFGREYTSVLLEAVESYSATLSLHDLVVIASEPVLKDLDRSFLN